MIEAPSSWLSNPNTPAWVQAVGTVLAILVAVLLPAWQRSKSLRDAAVDHERQEREHLHRLTTGLKAEINAALVTAHRHETVVTPGLQQLEKQRARGAIIKNDPIHPGSMSVTDAIIYRQIAAELGRLPPPLITSVVLFYTLALDYGRIADAASTAEQAYTHLQSLAPRLKMYGARLIKTMEKFEASGFRLDAQIEPTSAELRIIAAQVGYPLDDIARERGLDINASGPPHSPPSQRQ
jgi:uncharacterized membrane protein YccC